MILSLAYRLRKPPLVVASPYKTPVSYRIPPLMFVGVGGTVGGKRPAWGGTLVRVSPHIDMVEMPPPWLGYFQTFQIALPYALERLKV